MKSAAFLAIYLLSGCVSFTLSPSSGLSTSDFFHAQTPGAYSAIRSYGKDWFFSAKDSSSPDYVESISYSSSNVSVSLEHRLGNDHFSLYWRAEANVTLAREIAINFGHAGGFEAASQLLPWRPQCNERGCAVSKSDLPRLDFDVFLQHVNATGKLACGSQSFAHQSCDGGGWIFTFGFTGRTFELTVGEFDVEATVTSSDYSEFNVRWHDRRHETLEHRSAWAAVSQAMRLAGADPSGMRELGFGEKLPPPTLR